MLRASCQHLPHHLSVHNLFHYIDLEEKYSSLNFCSPKNEEELMWTAVKDRGTRMPYSRTKKENTMLLTIAETMQECAAFRHSIYTYSLYTIRFPSASLGTDGIPR